jgi:TonB family protein
VAVALGFRRRLRLGPALRIAPLPIAGLTLSTVMHVGFIVAVVIAVNALQESQPKVYVVNLVPAVAAVGSPQGRASVPAAPAAPRPEMPAPKAPAAKAELPARDAGAPRDLPPRNLPARDLPPRATARDASSLPERSLPARTAATPTPPRPDQKELPTVASTKAPTPAAPPPAAPAATTPAAATPSPPGPAAAAAPPQPLGQPTGSTAGSGKVTLDVDFPYAWYLRAIVNKISQSWDPKALPGQQPVITFEVGRDGQVNLGRIRIRQSSGNPAYDQVAIRAIAESIPFPPLPADFKAQLLTVHLQLHFSRDR